MVTTASVFTDHNSTHKYVTQPERGAWSPGERARWLPAGYRPALPVDAALEALLAEQGPIENMVGRMDLRRLYPNLFGNPVKIPCVWHKDLNNPSLGVFRGNIYCFTCGQSAEGLRAIDLLCDPPNPAVKFAYVRHILQETPVSDAPAAPPPPLEDAVVQQYVNNLKTTMMARRAWWEAKYGMGHEVQTAMHLGHSVVPAAFTFPFFNLDGRLLTIRYRRDTELWPFQDRVLPDGTIISDGMRYFSSQGRGHTEWYLPPGLRGTSIAGALQARWGTTTVIWTEQEISAALLAFKYQFPALSTNNGKNGWKQKTAHITLEELAGCRVIVAFDGDVEGTLGAAEVVDALTALGIEARQVVLPELAGCKGTDIGDLSAAGWTRRDIFNLFKR
jgi:hypothetical protein